MKMARIRFVLAGALKNSSEQNKVAKVRVAYPNDKNPLPRVWNPGGVANAETRSKIHQMNVEKVKSIVMYLKILILHRL